MFSEQGGTRRKFPHCCDPSDREDVLRKENTGGQVPGECFVSGRYAVQ